MSELPLYAQRMGGGVDGYIFTTDACQDCSGYIPVQIDGVSWESKKPDPLECTNCGAVYEFGLVRVDDNE